MSQLTFYFNTNLLQIKSATINETASDRLSMPNVF